MVKRLEEVAGGTIESNPTSARRARVDCTLLMALMDLSVIDY